MTDVDYEQHKLAALVNVLLPGTDGFISAGEAGVADALTVKESHARLARTMTAALDAAFASAAPADKLHAVTALESTLGEVFQEFVAAAYSAYYTAPAVLSVIARTSGYQHPPQPAGYTLPAFDDAVLEKVRRDPPSWRNALSSNTEGSRP